MIWLIPRRLSTTSTTPFKYSFVNDTIQDLLAPHAPAAQGHVMITKAKRTVKLALHLSLTRPMWMPPMLMAKVHTSPNKKAKASHKMILYLHKNYVDNNKLLKLIYKNKSATVKPTWNKQTKSAKSSSTLGDPNDNRRHNNRARREPQHEPSEHNSGNGQNGRN